MKYEDWERAKCIVACIDACKHNIKGYNDFKKANEIKIETTTVDLKPKAMYFTGEVKDRIVDLLIDKETKILNEKIFDLESL